MAKGEIKRKGGVAKRIENIGLDAVLNEARNGYDTYGASAAREAKQQRLAEAEARRNERALQKAREKDQKALLKAEQKSKQDIQNAIDNANAETIKKWEDASKAVAENLTGAAQEISEAASGIDGATATVKATVDASQVQEALDEAEAEMTIAAETDTGKGKEAEIEEPSEPVQKVSEDNSKPDLSYEGKEREKIRKREEKAETKHQNELAKKRLLEDAKIRAEDQKDLNSLLDGWRESAEARREAARQEAESAVTAGEKLKAAGKELAANMEVAAANVASNLVSAFSSSVSEAIDQYTELYSKYMGSIDARIQGAYDGMDFQSLNEVLYDAAAGNPYLKYTDVLENLNSLVEAGTAVNLTQRAFLATVSSKIATTFDATNSTLLRIIRLQEYDTTASRLGMEASLTELFNYYFSDTSYLSESFDNVTSALLDLTSTLDYMSSVEFEYIVQKWLGSLSSEGASDSTVQTIAEAINALGTGDVDWLTSNTAMQNLLVMAANRVGLDYSDMLVSGLNSNDINDLLYGVIDYIQEVTDGVNNVVKSAYADLFGLEITDITAIQNLTEEEIEDLYKSGMTYSQTLDELNDQLSQVSDRTHISEQINNIIENSMASIGMGIADSTAMYMTYKVADLVQSLTGGIYIPTISVMGTSVTLPNSIEEYVKMGVVGISTIGTLFSAISNWASGNMLGLDKWTSSWEKGTYSGYTSTNELSTSKSSTGVVSNTDSTGLQQSVYDEQEESGKEISGSEEEEDTAMMQYMKWIKEYLENGGSTTDPLLVKLYGANSSGALPVVNGSDYLNTYDSSTKNSVTTMNSDAASRHETLVSLINLLLEALQNPTSYTSNSSSTSVSSATTTSTASSAYSNMVPSTTLG